MTADLDTSIRASRVRVPRSRGAASGLLLVILGAWAALVPFIGPYLNVAFTPAPDKAWHWTSDRGWFHVLPGALTVLGGLLLLLSRSRVVTIFGAWLAVVSGAWLIVGPALAEVVNLSPGRPDPTSREGVRAFASLLFFYGIGAVILFVAALALGRLSVHSVRDVRAAERRVAAEEAAAAEEEQRQAREREAYAARDREQERERAAAGVSADGNGNGRHERTDGDAAATQHLPQQPGQPGQYQGQPGQQPYASAPPPPEQRN
jgi:pyruvate/2-oxoglutarate dehydrogenase complex dihydrolipoamide acyltransferase (E2) component